MPHTLGEWRTEAVSDCVRVVVGQGRRKIILARLAPKQLPEAETHANARMMAAAPAMFAALKRIRETLSDSEAGYAQLCDEAMHKATLPGSQPRCP
jgi:hypothetical protein